MGEQEIGHALGRLLKLSESELVVYKPSNVAESIALKVTRLALKGNLRAMIEIADRTEGKSPKTISVERHDKLDHLIIAYQERVLSEVGVELSRKEAIARLVAYRPAGGLLR